MKRIVFIYFSLALIIAGLNQRVSAQIDPHFTQNYMYPMAVNPALTGTMDGSYRVSSIYRNQWGNITNPFSTIGFSAEVTTAKNINVGAGFFRQTAGDSGYQYSSTNLSLSYVGVRFGQTGNQQISFGAQGGFVKSKFDPNGLRFGQQWLPGAGYVPGMSSGENIESLSSFVPDISFGMAYFNRAPAQTISPFAGISLYHVTQPSFSFLAAGGSNKLPMRLSAQAGLSFAINDGLSLVPHVVYNKQQEASEIIVATYAQFFVNEDIDFMFGGNMRINDSLSPFLGLYFKGVTAGISYDVNTGPLRTNAPNSNSFEFSLSFTGGQPRASNSVYFNCPRF